MSGRRCEKCGTMIAEGSGYCPNCGALSEDGSCWNTEASYARRAGYGRHEDTLGKMPLLIVVYGALAFLLGILLAISFLTFGNTWSDIADAEGLYYGLTESEFGSMVATFATIFLISGACAVSSGFLAGRRIMYRLAFVLCAVSALVLLTMAIVDIAYILLALVLCVIGLFMANKIRINADSFRV